MTGWQGNEQGQGGWQQPGPYGADPYQQPQNDPYNQGFDYGFGPDPYASPQYQTGSFPTGGYDFAPPPKRSKTPMVLGIIAMVVIVGAVVAVVLLNRKAEQTPAADDEKPDSKSTAQENPQQPPGGKDGWLTVDNKAAAGLVYQVPADWKTSEEKPDSGLNVPFSGLAEYGVYECEGASFTRSFVTSSSVQGVEGTPINLAQTVQDFGKSFATVAFNEGAQVSPAQPVESEVDGKEAVSVTARVTPQVTKPNCQSTESEVAVIGVQLEKDGKASGVALLVVVNDLAGGPAEPKPLDASVTQDILKTVTTG